MKKWILLLNFIVLLFSVIVTNNYLKDIDDSLAWANNLSANDVQSIEMVISPSDRENHYKKFPSEEFGVIIKIINASKGHKANAPAIESKLDAICSNSNPKVQLSSNPYDSTKDSKDFKDIVNLDDDALRYMLTKFENSKENGLKEYIMAIACSEILKENPETKKWASGREWYDSFVKANINKL